MRLRVLLVLCIFSLPGVVSAEDARLARELMLASGLQTTIERVPDDIQVGFAQQGEDMAALAAIVSRAFDTGEMSDMTAAGLDKNLTTRDMNYAMKWLQSPLGKRITALEAQAGPEVEKEIEQMMQQSLDTLTSDTRMTMLRNLDTATRSSEAAIDLILYMQVAMIMGISQVNPQIEALQLDQAVALLEQQRGDIEAAIMPYITVSLIHTYQDLDDKELQAYVDFATSKRGVRYHSAMQDAFNQAFLAQSKKAGEALGRFLMEIQQQQQQG